MVKLSYSNYVRIECGAAEYLLRNIFCKMVTGNFLEEAVFSNI
jgi:hypothetical protein